MDPRYICCASSNAIGSTTVVNDDPTTAKLNIGLCVTCPGNMASSCAQKWTYPSNSDAALLLLPFKVMGFPFRYPTLAIIDVFT